MSNVRACKDCVAALPEQIRQRFKAAPETVKGLRPAPFPGPRCHTHHRAFANARKQANHRNRVAQNFGLGPEGYDELLEIQGGRCGGCGVLPGPRAKRLAVDHDHTCCPGPTSCGRCVRGLLCHGCNDDLARVRDDGSKLRGLADYLDHWPARRRTVNGVRPHRPMTPEQGAQMRELAEQTTLLSAFQWKEAIASVRLDRDETHVVGDPLPSDDG